MLFARTMASLCAVLAMLTGALWVVRRYDLRLPGRVGGVRRGRLSVIERIALDTKRSLLLVRQDGREHLLLLSPEGHVVLDRGRVEQVEAPAHPIAEPANAVSDPDPAPDFTFFPWPRIAQPNQGMAAHCAA